MFAGYWLTEAELKKSFDGTPVHRPVHQHQVVYFRDRDEYNTALLPRQELIKMTLGIYMFDTHTCYFFAGEEQNDGTLNHEATHQLFQETRPFDPRFGPAKQFLDRRSRGLLHGIARNAWRLCDRWRVR